MTTALARTGLCLLLAFNLLPTHAQRGNLEVFRTFDDVVNQTPKDYGRFVYDDYKGQKNTRLVFRSERDKKDKIEIECSDIWGFMYDSAYYRIVKPGDFYPESRPHDFPVRIVRGGNIFFYENGISHLSALRYDRSVVSVENSYCAFMSETLNGPMALVPCANSPGWVKDGILGFFERYPQYKPISDCIGGKKKFYYDVMSKCVGEFPRE